jgi:hypothetical protein
MAGVLDFMGQKAGSVRPDGGVFDFVGQNAGSVSGSTNIRHAGGAALLLLLSRPRGRW